MLLSAHIYLELIGMFIGKNCILYCIIHLTNHLNKYVVHQDKEKNLYLVSNLLTLQTSTCAFAVLICTHGFGERNACILGFAPTGFKVEVTGGARMP